MLDFAKLEQAMKYNWDCISKNGPQKKMQYACLQNTYGLFVPIWLASLFMVVIMSFYFETLISDNTINC